MPNWYLARPEAWLESLYTPSTWTLVYTADMDMRALGRPWVAWVAMGGHGCQMEGAVGPCREAL